MQIRATHFSVMMGAAGVLLAHSAWAFDMGNMMNPSKWMGGKNDRYDDDYYYDGPGYGYPGGPPGYGYGGPPGYGYGGPPGYGYGGGPYGYGGAPGYGYGGAPGYGYGGAPGYGAESFQDRDAEILQLKRRVRELEGGSLR